MEPFLSILIPVYNYDPMPLLCSLQKQIERYELGQIELLVGDDASSSEYKDIYAAITQFPWVRLITAEKNGGAGAMRNLLAREAKGPLLLCLDSDITLLTDQFLATYIAASDGKSVVFGGHVYADYPPSEEQMLYYCYGRKIESRTASERNKHPYKAIGGVSFLIPRAIMLAVPFDEEVRMGYEDALWGANLKEARIPIKHIDNPIRHELRRNNEEFLCTTRRYIENLHRFEARFPKGTVHLLDVTKKYDFLVPLGAWLFSMGNSYMERRLCGKRPSLTLFQLYKWTYLCDRMSKENNEVRRVNRNKKIN